MSVGLKAGLKFSTRFKKLEFTKRLHAKADLHFCDANKTPIKAQLIELKLTAVKECLLRAEQNGLFFLN